MKILANDGLHPSGVQALQDRGFTVDQTTVSQGQLANYISKNQIEILLVRSNTQVDKALIDACSGLKIIGRGGIGMDHIAVDYALSKGIKVINTPNASAVAVAELVFAHLIGGARFLYDANRNMPLEGDTHFKDLKKSYATGLELRGKTLGIFGFGNIGQETAKIALGMGMKVVYHDPEVEKAQISIRFFDGSEHHMELTQQTKETVLQSSDFISLHIPSQDTYCLDKAAFEIMKEGVGIINTARGNAIDEVALIEYLNNKKVAFAGLDVFESEPKPEIQILMHPNISLSPHIGASTLEAQEKIGLSLAAQITEIYA
ncbi:MAG: D-2-hydroxyacid dehydrogenase [Flavobacteriaceae bacterium]|nr:D-2-hydroxyacid dehydrogenase [Flavobacteriaceae bacterium]MCI5087543.1 D-2-hydroxyacid dehydrogenase [Flavobacteriaceae bacterium]